MQSSVQYIQAGTKEKKFGKYQGIVIKSQDPLHAGRIQVEVAAVHGNKAVWAQPCVPYAAPDLGLFMIPPKDALVWIEFIGGDRNKAIWSGCYWKNQQAPSRKAEEMVIATPDAKIIFNAQSPKAKLRIELSDGTAITIKDKSIVLEAGTKAKIELANTKTNINGTALEVS